MYIHNFVSIKLYDLLKEKKKKKRKRRRKGKIEKEGNTTS